MSFFESAVIWVPYSPTFTKWSFIGTGIALVLIWLYYHHKR